MLHRRTADGPIVLPPDSDEPALLAGAAAAIWLLLDEPQLEATLQTHLAETAAEEGVETLPSEPAWRTADVLHRLAAAGIVEVVP